MRAVLLTGFGGHDRLSVRHDVPTPAPTRGEVLIKVAAAGVNNTDINTRAAWYSRAVTAAADDAGWTGDAPHFPRIQGADACGRIVAVGQGVDPARIGQRVLVEPVFRDPAEPDSFKVVYFGSERDGAFADYVCAPSRHAHTIVSPLTDIELASFPCAYSAAENMLTRADVREGETVVVTGASGGVGSAAVQLARRRGARVIAQVGAGKAADILSLGADSAMIREEDPITALGEDSVDVVIDAVGGPNFGSWLRALRRGGRYAAAGAIAGPIVSLDLRTLYLKDLTLLGCTVLAPEVFPRLLAYIERGEIKPLVAEVFDLADIVAAQTAFLTKRHIGKIVLRVE
jgi:NADPH:quinone reductase-like Zn-dependent oxidoreductase